jgi:MYXO-CTERM domain-containing protein
LKKVLVLTLGLALAALVCGAPAWADGVTYVDPANLHIGPGAGTTCATGCAGDPNTIGSGGFDIYYNSQGNGNLAIGNPFYVIVATPVYAGSNNSPTVGGTANLISPYPGGSATSIAIGGANTGTEMTSANSGTVHSVYDAVGITLNTNNSFSFGNMVGCDTGVGGCPNSSLLGSGAPLFGTTITGFDVTYFSIGTTSFNPGDLLDFTGTLPIGYYVSAVGVNGTEAWAVPFTESGLVTTTTTPEPGSLPLLGLGLLGLGLLASRRTLTA